MKKSKEIRPRISPENYQKVFKILNCTDSYCFDFLLKSILKKLEELESADSKTKPADMKEFTGEPAT